LLRGSSLNPNFALAYHYRGAAYINKGQYDKALEDYNKAIAINPSDSNIYNSRGHLFGFFKGQYDMAIRDFDKALLLSPDGAYYYNRGLIYTYKGEYDRAIEDYNKAITIYPLADIYNSRGEAYLKLGVKGEAISDFKKACDMGNELGCKGLQMALENR